MSPERVSVGEEGSGQKRERAREPSTCHRVQELCESRGGRPGLPSPVNLRFLWT